ncbi:MAG TPA: isoleucine--tRNA ligase [Lentisphaeria bacterium]|nr:MAG: isoleucine--tRNA ligase [Lentisphaerae bacterium GWF2_49_21]HBC86617.1 isoleucine--tRNA ligase [Lentisphaeria bacterium]
MFNPVNNQANFPEIEKKTLEYWGKEQIFEKSVSLRKGGDEFVFYDGPPFATGLPHYGHLLAGTIKDVIPRYQTMKGKYVDRVFGWDCHGLPVEYEMEKELNLAGKKDIEKYGIDKFNESCRGIVLRYTAEWEATVRRMGRWVDFKRGYKTMDRDYMESIWWVVKQLWDQGLIYEGYKILPYCPRCATPLSNFEANQGYEEVEDPAITLRFQDIEDSTLSYLAWTTTPWTLPSNLALAAGADIEYVKVKDKDNFYVLAEARLGSYYKKPEDYQIVDKFKGSKLEGRKYIPLFPYFAKLAEKGAFRIVNAEFVSIEDGTGIVHMAPGFGEDDAAAAKKFGIPEVCPVDEECNFTAEVPDYAGRYVKETDKDIIRRLKTEGKLVHRGTIKHNYPHCWRDDSPLIYRSISTWFVKIDPIKEKMLRANSGINWVPSHIRDGRFGKWLENARDWAVSRNRYWGCPLPIWRNQKTGETICVGSVAELEKLSGAKLPDIHKHFVDPVKIPSRKGGDALVRIPEVLDCWFESGSMPYAQQHYPFENKAHFEANFPADFIAEGLDQTRGWFYTLVVLSAALFDKSAFKNVVVNGLILAEDGQKMSKRKKNYPDPKQIIDSYGADSLRLFLLGSSVVRGEDLRFSETGIKDILRGVLIPLWNSYSFFVTYANLDKWEPPKIPSAPENPQHPLDRWILSSLSEMVEEISDSMDNYMLQQAANRFEKFIDDLTNWYIRRSRRRFWKSQNDSDKDNAYRTLHYVLVTFCKTAAPFIPYITESIYKNLKSADMPESVHLCDYPIPEKFRRDERLEKQMEHTIRAVSLGRHLRSQLSIRVRQPLRKVVIAIHSEEIRRMLSETSDIIAEELNVKEVQFRADETELVKWNAKANFKSLGSKLGKDMKEAASLISTLDHSAIHGLVTGGTYTLSLSNGTEHVLTQDDVVIQREEKAGLTVATEAEITIALDTVIDPELKEEGLSREFVSRIQNMRKESGFEVSDRIEIYFSGPPELVSSLKNFSEYVRNETLALKLEQNPLAENVIPENINGLECKISIRKV